MSLLLLALACTTPPMDTAQPYKSEDADGDGWTVGSGDCDDQDADVYPGATEIWYDGIDEDCDGNDADQDGDGARYGAGDCDDTRADVFVGAAELCDGLDNDCDEAIDENPKDGVTGWQDADGDGFGDPAADVTGCEATSGVVSNADDCDDGDATTNPDAPEACDGLDNDCDGVADDNASGRWYADADGDGYGDDAITLDDCAGAEGYVAVGGDCDDTTFTTNPGAPELCDSVDSNCDGDATAGATDATAWYVDGDGDTYGDEATVTFACTQPLGTQTLGGDCDDGDPTISPDAEERCDAVDNDCDGAVDDAPIDGVPLYADTDGDGFGDADAGTGCEAGAGTSTLDGDCDDAAANVYPGAAEACDGIDGDCDGAADDPSLTGIAWEDLDADGFGSPDVEVSWSCVPPEGTVSNNEDCDDSDASISPDATEVCNALDDDCDGDMDESGAGTVVYTDADGDGYGDPATADASCTPPADTVEDATDCDDADADISPNADETCNGLDDDCDGTIDDGAIGATTWYPDNDGDGYGSDADAFVACDADALPTGGDCDDTSARSYPGATEVCDHQDNNCSGDTDDETGAGQLDGDTFTDRTALFATGKSTDPLIVGDQSSYDLVLTDTTLHLCAGTFYAKFVTANAGTHLRVVGSGADQTTITTAGTTTGILGSIVAASNSTVDLTDLTLSGGIGSSGTKGGAIVASQTTGTATPATPNITLTRAQVTANATQYGGAIAINNYGWVALVDTVVSDNTASSAGGAAWVQDTGKLTCAATSLGAAGVYANTAPQGGGVWFDSTTHGSLSFTGCDWGASTSDNADYDIQVNSGAGTCYPDAASLTDTVTCGGGSCTASTDTSCP